MTTNNKETRIKNYLSGDVGFDASKYMLEYIVIPSTTDNTGRYEILFVGLFLSIMLGIFLIIL